MTGPENYREALRLVDSAFRTPGQYGEAAEAARQDLMAAQVHATLALAASNVDLFAPSTGTAQAWREAVGS